MFGGGSAPRQAASSGGLQGVVRNPDIKENLKQDKNCDNVNGKYDGVDAYYSCRFIEYGEINSVYVDMFGQNLPKTTLTMFLDELFYDEEENVYRHRRIMTGGGWSTDLISEIINF